MSKELQELTEQQFIDKLNDAFHHTSDYPVGNVMDYLLPRTLKNKAF
jgi:hypothetical protein